MERKSGKPFRSFWINVIACSVAGFLLGSFLAASDYEISLPFGEAADASFATAMGVGTFYILIGAFLLTALAWPGFRRSVFKENDARDIEEQRHFMLLQSCAAIAFGAMLLVLALAGPVAIIAPSLGVAIILALLVVGAWLYARSLRLADEMMRIAILEAAAITYGLLLLIVGGWAALAHTGFLGGPAMLDIATSFWVLAQVGTLVAIARRGMLEDG